MTTYIITKQFYVDADNLQEAEFAANWIGYAAIENPQCKTYMTETKSIEELK